MAPWKMNKFHNYETEKITRKASDAAEYIELFGSSTARDRHARRINVILWTSADIRPMHCRAWRSWMEEPNNTL